jgi:hypothetical protein
MNTLAQLTRSGAEAFVRLAAKASEAEAIQWEASPRPKTKNEEGGKSSGYGDPTFDTATDERRLAVREKVQAAYVELVRATAAAREATAALDAAIREWEGYRP